MEFETLSDRPGTILCTLIGIVLLIGSVISIILFHDIISTLPRKDEGLLYMLYAILTLGDLLILRVAIKELIKVIAGKSVKLPDRENNESDHHIINIRPNHRQHKGIGIIPATMMLSLS